jgi:hypothetical protein
MLNFTLFSVRVTKTNGESIFLVSSATCQCQFVFLCLFLMLLAQFVLPPLLEHKWLECVNGNSRHINHAWALSLKPTRTMPTHWRDGRCQRNRLLIEWSRRRPPTVAIAWRGESISAPAGADGQQVSKRYAARTSSSLSSSFVMV